jgi:RimJ/RimL family protein N-acetyltransferase
VALRDKEVVARAAWWGGPEDDAPLTLDWFDFTDLDAASELPRTAPLRAEYILKAEDLDYLRWMPSPREWWRLAYTPAGELVGVSAPTRHYTSAVVGYIGVVPEQRGHGYSFDLLVEATHLLIAEGAEQIVAGTDCTNLPMAATFARVGYPVDKHRIDMV